MNSVYQIALTGAMSTLITNHFSEGGRNRQKLLCSFEHFVNALNVGQAGKKIPVVNVFHLQSFNSGSDLLSGACCLREMCSGRLFCDLCSNLLIKQVHSIFP